MIVVVSYSLLSLSDPVGLQLVVREIVLRLAPFAAKFARSPVFLRCLNVNVKYVLFEVTGRGVIPAAVRAHRSEG